MSGATQIGDYLQVRRLPDLETGKTCKWAVLSSSGDELETTSHVSQSDTY